MKLVAFGLDGTLIDAESIDEFAKLAGKEKEVSKIGDKLAAGNMEFEDALNKKVRMLNGIDIKKIESTASKISLMNGAKETIEVLRRKGIKTCLITGSFSIIVERIKKELNVDYVASNELVVENGKATGEVKVLVDGTSKGVIFKEIAKKAGVQLSESVAVGNSLNDISMFKKAGLSIAFNPKSAVGKVANIVIERKDLRRILPYIFNDVGIDTMLKECEKLNSEIEKLEGEIRKKRAALLELDAKKHEFIGVIKVSNAEANRSRRLRDELNKKVKKNKLVREEINAKVKELLAEYKKQTEKSPRVDFRKMQREVDRLEWKLQTSVMEIKKEDALVEQIKKLRKELEGFREIIELSEKIEKNKKASRKVHEEILSLSTKSQQHHKEFLHAVEKIKKTEEEIDKINEKRNEIVSSLNELNKNLNENAKRLRALRKDIKTIEVEMKLRSSGRSEKELKSYAEVLYKKFKKGNKLDLDDIYLLRRFNLV